MMQSRVRSYKSELVDLENMTEALPPTPMWHCLPGVSGDGGTYESHGSEMNGVALLDDPEKRIKIGNFFIPAGMELPEHVHKGREWVFIYAGHLVFKAMRGDKKATHECEQGGWIFFDAGISHSARAIVDTWCAGITMPADEGYPNV